jgi:hypothetical protein
MPKQDGRNMTMVLGPDKKAQAKAPRPEPAPGAGTEESPATEAPAEQMDQQEPVAVEATE